MEVKKSVTDCAVLDSPFGLPISAELTGGAGVFEELVAVAVFA
jgi:hypothetical protein